MLQNWKNVQCSIGILYCVSLLVVHPSRAQTSEISTIVQNMSGWALTAIPSNIKCKKVVPNTKENNFTNCSILENRTLDNSDLTDVLFKNTFLWKARELQQVP